MKYIGTILVYLNKTIKKHVFPYFRYFCFDPINNEQDKKNPPKKKKTSTAKKAFEINKPTFFLPTTFKMLSSGFVGVGNLLKNSCPNMTHNKLKALIPSKKSSPLDF